MQDENITGESITGQPGQKPSVLVVVKQGEATQSMKRFENTFTIGRHKDNDLQVTDACVSKFHVKVEHDGKRYKMQNGRVTITFDGYLDTDYEDRWEQKPFYFFLRTIFDKWIYRTYSTEYEELLIENVTQLQQAIKSFLNLYRYNFGAQNRPSLWKL